MTSLGVRSPCMYVCFLTIFFFSEAFRNTRFWSISFETIFTFTNRLMINSNTFRILNWTVMPLGPFIIDVDSEWGERGIQILSWGDPVVLLRDPEGILRRSLGNPWESWGILGNPGESLGILGNPGEWESRGIPGNPGESWGILGNPGESWGNTWGDPWDILGGNLAYLTNESTSIMNGTFHKLFHTFLYQVFYKNPYKLYHHHTGCYFHNQ